MELRNNHAHQLHDQRQLGTAGGGGLANYGGPLTLTNCNVSGNSAQYGGGVRSDGFGAKYGAEYATTTLTNCTISGNSAVWGGGLQNIYGAITLANCAVDNNQAVGSFDVATAEGGGILSERWESLDLQQHTRREHGNRRRWS